MEKNIGLFIIKRDLEKVKKEIAMLEIQREVLEKEKKRYENMPD